MTQPFLTARWENLVLFTYPVPPEKLADLVPPGLSLDLKKGQAFVSLVGFQFRDTRVKGIAWPGHVSFEEINLRFYVRDGEQRGVSFFRELVPRRLISAAARLLYNEPYAVARIASRVEESEQRLRVEYRLWMKGVESSFSVTADSRPNLPVETSDEHFFKEHQWGFGTDRRGRLLRYEVQHPVWETYPVLSHELHLDWGALYGPRWAFLQTVAPCSVVLAAGSAISVYPPARLRQPTAT